MDLTCRWTPARQYLEWARAAVKRGEHDGWDTGLGLAKRAACRQMDGILAHNHLGCFHGTNYKKKTEYLADLRIPGLALLRDLVIDPRNDIEHAYELATQEQAERACDVAELFLGATDTEAGTPAIMALGWNVNVHESICTAPGKEHHILKLELKKDHSPMLVIVGYPDAPETLVINPAEETVGGCPLQHFTSDQVLTLNAKLRECLTSQNYSSRSVSESFLVALREQLQL